jgi:hypothetical protein
MLANKLMCSGAATRLAIEECFACHTYTGNGSTQTITNGIDLATYGGMVHIKERAPSTGSHSLFDTTRGQGVRLRTDSTAAQASNPGSGVYQFNSNGFAVNDTTYANNTTSTSYVSWTYRNAPKFYTHSTKSHTNGVASTVDLSTLGTVGMVRVKRTDNTSSWYVWHRSLTTGKLLIGETTAAEATDSSISVSGTTLTIASAMATGTYLVEAWAHDTSADGLIQCGSFTTDGSGNATVTLGWEPQYVLFKRSSGVGDWTIEDNARGFPSGPGIEYLLANSSAAANTFNGSGSNAGGLTATGFVLGAQGSASSTYIYLAIRRGPMKPPTSGTQVYQAINRLGTDAVTAVTGVGFPPDFVHAFARGGGQPIGVGVFDRLRGANMRLRTMMTEAESTRTAALNSFDIDGFTLGDGSDGSGINSNAYVNIYHCFRRYPGVFDFFADTGTGANKTEAHGLTVAPKFWFRKGRSGATQWVFGSTLLAATEKIVSPSPAGKVTDATAWNSTYPTATAFSVGTAAAVNTSSATYITYLVGELAGISKVFGYTGNGSNQTIDCGFAAGARLVLIVRTDTTGSFWIFDTVRGLIAGNDPALALDTTAAEVTTVDALDPAASGFIVNQEATFNLNVNTATYIGFALS